MLSTLIALVLLASASGLLCHAVQLYEDVSELPTFAYDFVVIGGEARTSILVHLDGYTIPYAPVEPQETSSLTG
ncbi:hypothetical protein B0H13DRAFT_2106754 [Mycena leptocephala]|jgi:hypothetical protein|nr:hypothetical protein B0H13DRAFT_2106754 [Mycena leptocephala]